MKSSGTRPTKFKFWRKLKCLNFNAQSRWVVLCLVFTVNCIIAVQSIYAQVGSPFDLTPRLDTTKVYIPEAQLPPSRIPAQPKPHKKRNPFDLARAGGRAEGSNTGAKPLIKLPKLTGLGAESALSMSRGTFDTILSFSLLILLALAILLQGGPLRKMFASALNSNTLSSIQREQRKFGYFFWASLGMIMMGSFLFVSARHFYPSLTTFSWQTLGLLVLVAHSLIVLKLLALQLIKAVFPLERPIRNYQMLILVYAGIIGVSLFPLLVLVSFSTPILANIVAYTGLGVVGLGYLFRSLRGLGDSSRYIIDYPLHFLLYLCALEIGPLVVALKLLTA